MSDLWRELHCPYCGETFEAPVEADGGESQVIDCAVCCRPIHLRVCDGVANTRRDDEV